MSDVYTAEKYASLNEMLEQIKKIMSEDMEEVNKVKNAQNMNGANLHESILELSVDSMIESDPEVNPQVNTDNSSANNDIINDIDNLLGPEIVKNDNATIMETQEAVATEQPDVTEIKANNMEQSDILSDMNLVEEKKTDESIMQQDIVSDDVVKSEESLESVVNDQIGSAADDAISLTSEVKVENDAEIKLDDNLQNQSSNLENEISEIMKESKEKSAPAKEIEVPQSEEVIASTTSLISKEVASESSKVLMDLVKAVEKPSSDGLKFRNGTTLEQLVIELIKPDLSKWLDENLPNIVKHVVEKEIRKLIPKD